MRLYSATIIAKNGRIDIKRDVFVIARDEESAMQKLKNYIVNDRRLLASEIKGVYISEEAAIS